MNNEANKILKLTNAIDQMKRELPRVLANDVQKFFGDSFAKQGWLDSSLSKWAKRKSTKDSGRSILVKSGALRRAVLNSARVITFDKIQFIVDLPYAAVHNEGGTFTRKSHVKTSTAARNIQHVGMFTGSITSQKYHSISGSHNVGANVAVYPQRKFMGDSQKLRDILKKKINLAVKSCFK